jgi:6-phosphogluconate dehydrogenase
MVFQTNLEAKGAHTTPDYADFAKMLKTPKVIYLSVPAGPTIDLVLSELAPHLSKGDVIMDGGIASPG